MFWKNEYTPSLKIADDLQREDITLKELLEDHDILQEYRSQNKHLVEFFKRDDILEELVKLITVEPPNNVPEIYRFRYSNIACEILTSSQPILIGQLVVRQNILEKLYAFLEQDSPLNPLLSSFFSKTFGMLISRQPEQDWFSYQCVCLQVLEFIKNRKGFLDAMYKHIGTTAIMDLLFHIITDVKGPEPKRTLFEWLHEQELIHRLIDILGNDCDTDKHNNIAQLICDLITTGRMERQNVLQEPTSAESSPIASDILINAFEDECITKYLLDIILSVNAKESTIVSGIKILLKLLENPIINEPVSDTALQFLVDAEKDHHQKLTENILQQISPKIADFHALLLKPPKKPDIQMTVTLLSPPFGITRLSVCTLFTVLIETKNPLIIQSICKSDFFNTLLKLFKQYCWNNILHNQVKKCVACALTAFDHNSDKRSGSTDIINMVYDSGDNNGDGGGNNSGDGGGNNSGDGGGSVDGSDSSSNFIPSALQKHIIVNCKIVSKLIDCWMYNKNETQSAGNNNENNNKKKCRLGYMGHLIDMFDLLVSSMLSSDQFRALVESNINADEQDNWQIITQSDIGELAVELKNQKLFLAGINPAECSSFMQKEFQDDYSNETESNMQNAVEDLANTLYQTNLFEEACNNRLFRSYNFDEDSWDDDDDDDTTATNDLANNLQTNNLKIGFNHLIQWGSSDKEPNPIDNYDIHDDDNDDATNTKWATFSMDNFADFDQHFNAFQQETITLTTATTSINDATITSEPAGTTTLANDFPTPIGSQLTANKIDNNVATSSSGNGIPFSIFNDRNNIFDTCETDHNPNYFYSPTIEYGDDVAFSKRMKLINATGFNNGAILNDNDATILALDATMQMIDGTTKNSDTNANDVQSTIGDVIVNDVTKETDNLNLINSSTDAKQLPEQSSLSNTMTITTTITTVTKPSSPFKNYVNDDASVELQQSDNNHWVDSNEIQTTLTMDTKNVDLLKFPTDETSDKSSTDGIEPLEKLKNFSLTSPIIETNDTTNSNNTNDIIQHVEQ